MKHLLIAATVLMILPVLGAARSPAQSMDDLNLQVHGYSTQGFIYSTNNNWNTTDSTDGSAAWTEAVVNLTAQPQSRLRIGMQARYYLLGSYGNAITLDWAEADYKVNEKFGFRVGKVKTPMGLLNEEQDIDPVYLWVMLPQGVYPLASRSSTLAHYGGVVYGAVSLGESLGKLEYRVAAGELEIASDDGYFEPYRDQGLNAPSGLGGPIFTANLHWRTPIEGLTLGANQTVEKFSGAMTMGPYSGTASTPGLKPYIFFARYEQPKFMLAAEYGRAATIGLFELTGLPTQTRATDQRSFYVLASHKVSNKLTAGTYYSSGIDRKAAFTPARYQKDWTISARYDFNPYLYLKAEQHFVDGTMRGYSTSDNPDGLKPNTRMTLLKLGVSF